MFDRSAVYRNKNGVNTLTWKRFCTQCWVDENTCFGLIWASSVYHNWSLNLWRIGLSRPSLVSIGGAFRCVSGWYPGCSHWLCTSLSDVSLFCKISPNLAPAMIVRCLIAPVWYFFFGGFFCKVALKILSFLLSYTSDRHKGVIWYWEYSEADSRHNKKPTYCSGHIRIRF